MPTGELDNRQSAADRALVQAGITFNVYGESAGVEKTLPFDLVPRIVTATEWERIEKGLKQRIRALNLFIDDLYHEQKNHQRRRGAGGDYFLVQGLSRAMRGAAIRRAVFGVISPARIWSAIATGKFMCWRIICVVLRVFLTCWRIGG